MQPLETEAGTAFGTLQVLTLLVESDKIKVEPHPDFHPSIPRCDAMTRQNIFLYILLLLFSRAAVASANEQEVFFENKVRPLLAEHCFECHSDKKQQGDLRLDRKQFVFAEGPAGKPVVPANLEESRLWQVIQFDEFDTQMPPSGKLPPEALATLKQWIETGAYWPDEEHLDAASENGGVPLKDDGTIDFVAAIEQHWAYQTVKEPSIPDVDDPTLTSSIDRFVAAKLNEHGLTLSPRASKQTLIRRLSFDLRGLPPSYEEVKAFEANQSEDAFAQLVDQYLADPAYGQRWGRHWLDIARYADTKGYVFTENRFYPYSYTYRDYVIDAFSSDKPYDTFVMEQLAADHLGYSENDPRLAALGFLTIGPRFLNRTPDIIDDRIDVVTRGLMGMTLGCARCHDHKFDPLPTADYYSLYGVFDSTHEPDLPPLRGEIDTDAPGYAEFAAELKKREDALANYKTQAHQDLLAKGRNEVADYLPAAAQKMGLIKENVALSFQHGTPRDKIVHRWKDTIEARLKSDHPVILPWKSLMAVDEAQLAEKLPVVLEELSKNGEVPTVIIDTLRERKPDTRLGVVQVYVDLLSSVRDEWTSLLKENPETAGLPDPGRELIRRLMFGPGSYSDLAAGDYSPLFERDNRDKVRKLEKAIDDWRVTSPHAPARSMVLLDKDKLSSPVIFVRGTPGRRGDRVPRRGPQILNPDPDAVFKETSGRLPLAEQIVSKENPLTARVFVNRVWMYHFGTPLVETTSDFGLRTEPPVHRELLDYLAWSFMHKHNWSIKGLHREILLTRTWQQESVNRADAKSADPENQLYWKQNRRRLEFEAMRDSMLAVAGRLDKSSGGRPVDIEQKPFSNRRSVYALIDRNNPSGLLRTFDFPSPDSSSPGRSETTVPQQALYGMNSEFSQEMASDLTKRVEQISGDKAVQVRELIKIVFSRDATESEVAAMTSYLETHALNELSQALLMTNEFFFVD